MPLTCETFSEAVITQEDTFFFSSNPSCNNNPGQYILFLVYLDADKPCTSDSFPNYNMQRYSAIIISLASHTFCSPLSLHVLQHD